MKPVRFHLAAEAELAAEAAYYDERSHGLGERFVTEIEAACALAAGFSGIGSPYRYGTRRVFAKRFPFAVVYRELPAAIVVLAIAPYPRQPGYWRGRKACRRGQGRGSRSQSTNTALGRPLASMAT